MFKTPNLRGRLNKLVTIEEPAETKDSYNQSIRTWCQYAMVWASVEPLQGREYQSAQETQSETKVRFRIHYIEGVTTSMRISFNGKLYNIMDVINPRESNFEMQLMTSEGVVADGG